MRKTSVKIDLQKLAVRLSGEANRIVGLGEIHTWLSARGFRSAGSDWWGCAEADLFHLKSDEITHVRLHVCDGVVTFVEDEISSQPVPGA